MKRRHDNQPDVFLSPGVEDYDFICDHVGVYPIITQQKGGVRCQKEILDGQRVVHAYGVEGGGYVFSFGFRREVAQLVAEFSFDSQLLKNTKL